MIFEVVEEAGGGERGHAQGQHLLLQLRRHNALQEPLVQARRPMLVLHHMTVLPRSLYSCGEISGNGCKRRRRSRSGRALGSREGMRTLAMTACCDSNRCMLFSPAQVSTLTMSPPTSASFTMLPQNTVLSPRPLPASTITCTPSVHLLSDAIGTLGNRSFFILTHSL